MKDLEFLIGYALAVSKPIINNFIGWQSNIANDENVGFNIASNNIVKAANQLVDKLNDKTWLQNASENAYKLAKERFSRDKLAKELEEILKKVVDQHLELYQKTLEQSNL